MEWSEMRGKVLARVRPGAEEERSVTGFAQGLLLRVNSLLLEAGFEASAELHGSVAHGTWVSGETDLDIFVVLSPRYGRGDLGKILEMLKGGLDGEFVEAYAEHPYLRARMDGFKVDFVPCFRVDPAVGIISSTDRTPHHTRYLAGVLDDGLRDEVRLLKQWARGVGVYGAEIRVGGLSGYLCELLVLAHGSFEALMEAASGWSRGAVVQVGSALDESGLRERFQEPLVVVDPVDPSRNVASAVTTETFWTLVAAAGRFVEEPREHFFWGPAVKPTGDDVLGLMGGTDVAFLVVEESHAEVADSLWGQIHKTKEALHGQLEAHGFRVLASTAWSDEERRHVLAFRVESGELPPVTMRQGPPVGLARDSKRFIEAHLGAEATVAGPGIRDGRWVVLSRREHTSVKALLSHLLEDGGRGVGVSRNLSVRVLQHHRLLLNREIGPYLEGGLVDHLYWFLKGRPFWLD